MPIDFSFLEGGASQNENTSQNSDTANVTIRVDVDSLLLCDGDYIDQPFKAGALTKIQLPIGQHILEFLSEENPDIKVEKIVEFQEAGKSYLVIVNELKAAAAEAADTCVIPEGVEALRSKKEFMKYYKGESKVILPSSLKILGDHTGATIFGDDNYDTRAERRDEFEELLTEQEFDEAAKLEKFLAKLEKEKVDIRHIDLSKCTKLEIVGKCTFKYCYYLSSVILPNSLREIQNSAFYKCQELKEIVIPENVNIIGSFAFTSCKRLNKIHFEKPNVVKFGRSAFSDCISLKSITLSESVTEIGECAFESCSSLKSITIPESVTVIGGYTFYRCYSLKDITIPKSVTEIGYKAFAECKSLEKVHFEKPRGVTFKNEAFLWCKALKSFNAPTEPIGAFKGCENLMLK